MDGTGGLGNGRASETVPGSDHWMWLNATVTCTAQPEAAQSQLLWAGATPFPLGLWP